jgi:predicted dehydrogenase
MTSEEKPGTSRRQFIRNSAIGAAGIALGGYGFTAKSYARIPGSNDRIRFAVVGVNSRGIAHIDAILKGKNAHITHICDVDSTVLEKTLSYVSGKQGSAPSGQKDIRKLLEIKDIDAITIATPDHWHAPMAILGVQAGKHVYLEKPSSHNIHENQMLLSAFRKEGKLIQMGNQQRSSVTSAAAIQKIRDGVIGEPYHARAWYANTRGPIGIGKAVAVPANLDWDLWQGPAPRREFKDNIVHYNWHWFRHWGTGEALNNGLHELDICRWALGKSYPTEVLSQGGRFHGQDDWEFTDNQLVTFKYPDGKIITWEGKSCNGLPVVNRGRGVLVYGTKGSILLDRNGYILYDIDGKQIEEVKEAALSATMNTQGAGNLDVVHMLNFMDGIRNGAMLNSPIRDAIISVNLCHLANIAQFTGGYLQTDPQNGGIIKNKEAQKLTGREYEPGWAPKI